MTHYNMPYEGHDHTHPNGVIYLITGVGGAHLYNPEQQDRSDTWQAFTHRFISRQFSLTVVDRRGKSASFQQLAPDGVELDSFVIRK